MNDQYFLWFDKSVEGLWFWSDFIKYSTGYRGDLPQLKVSQVHN